MGLFKKKVIREIDDGIWGALVNLYQFDVDTLSKEIRCVEKEGKMPDNKPVKFLRIFRLSEIKSKALTITGWETFDEYPELILFEGYLTKTNEAHLKRKKE